MIKRDEIADPSSCWNKAGDGERVFVILERDVAAPDTVREWCRLRIALGKNKLGDPQISEAMEWARLVEMRDAE